MLSSFPVSLPSENTLSHPPFPCFCEGLPTSTHPFPPPHPRFSYTGASFKPSEDQGPLLPFMHDKAILCYICRGSYVYSFVDGLVPGSSGGVWLVYIVFLPMGLQTPSTLLVPSLNPLLGTTHSVQCFTANICLCI